MKTCLTALSALMLSASAFAVPADEAAAWQEDLDVYVQNLEAAHMDLFHTLPEAVFRHEINTLRASLDTLTQAEIVATLMRLHHSVEDGHTAIPLWDYGYHRFPIDIELVDGAALVTGVRLVDSDVLGGVIETVDGRPFSEIAALLAPVVPFVENEGSLAVRTASYFPVAELMHAIGAIEAENGMTLGIRVGDHVHTLELSAQPGDAYNASLERTLDYRAGLDASGADLEIGRARFHYLADDRLGYIRMDGYPSQQDMQVFAGAIYGLMDERGGENLVIDLRGNYGGNFYVGLELAHYLNLLDGVDWANGVYVLTSGITFSAAMSNSAQFSGILNARRVGEATGANPCGYQDMGQFNLPNSGLLITYSKRWFCFAEAHDAALQPDVMVPVTVDHWRNGHDAALDWVRSDIQSR